MKIRTVKIDGQDLPAIKTRRGGKKAYLCQRCGTWKCTRCGAVRRRANRNYSGVLSCPKDGCGCLVGEWTVIYHGSAWYYLCNDEVPPNE